MGVLDKFLDIMKLSDDEDYDDDFYDDEYDDDFEEKPKKSFFKKNNNHQTSCPSLMIIIKYLWCFDKRILSVYVVFTHFFQLTAIILKLFCNTDHTFATIFCFPPIPRFFSHFLYAFFLAFGTFTTAFL